MNYITRLKNENDALKAGIENVDEAIVELLQYYNSDKFQGAERNYAHVTTDIYPRLQQLRSQLTTTLNQVS